MGNATVAPQEPISGLVHLNQRRRDSNVKDCGTLEESRVSMTVAEVGAEAERSGGGRNTNTVKEVER